MTTILKTVKEVRAFRRQHADKSLGFVPTMGNLHDGHMSLMRLAQQQSDVVLASIFVNPTQFAPNEDLEAYPRTFNEDVAKLQSIGVDAVFCPDEAAIYPYGKEQTLLINLPQSMTGILCGIHRPTHFQGVATVVAKLFQIVHPDVAVFGKKDFQQLAIIRRLNKELFMNIRIIGGEIIREKSGLAMSSRNQYLNANEREQAANIANTLQRCRQRLQQGDAVSSVLSEEKQILNHIGIAVEYLDFRDKTTLSDKTTVDNGIVLIATRIGETRLIDNVPITTTD